MAETHRCLVGGPLPESLNASLRRNIGDRELETSIVHALLAILRQLDPHRAPAVDLTIIHGKRGTLEFGIRHGAVRETLIYTLPV